METARLARSSGAEIAAIVEVLEAAQADARVFPDLADVPVLTGQVIHRALGGLDGVERIAVGPPGGPTREIACDTVCLAVGLAPAIELLNVLGGGLTMDSARGGHAPVMTGAVETTLPNVLVVGDCAGLVGLGEAGLDRARAQGAAAGLAALGHHPTFAPSHATHDTGAYQMAWMRALLSVGDDQVIV